MEKAIPERRETPNASALSVWEWLPPLAVVVLAVLYFTAAKPGGNMARFCLFVGVGLLPGTLWRLAGRSSWNVHRVFFAAGLIAFVLDNPALRPDRATWERMLGNWPLVTLGFLISFTQSLWGMLRTHRLLTDSGVAIGMMETLKLCLCGSFFNIFLPGSTGGDAYRVYAITRGHGTRLAPAIASISLDRFLGLPSLILVVVMGMVLDYEFFRANRILSKLIPFIAGAGLVCLILVAYLVNAGKAHRSGRIVPVSHDGIAGAGPRGWLRRIRALLRRTHAMIATNITRPATLPLALLYGFLSHLACIASCQCFGYALGVEGVPALRYYLIVPMAMAINSIPGAPGGVGQGELAMAELLEMAGPGLGNAQAGVMIMLLFRLSNMAVGLAGGALYAMGKRDFRPQDAAAPQPAALSESMDQIRRESARLFLDAAGAENGPPSADAEQAGG